MAIERVEKNWENQEGAGARIFALKRFRACNPKGNFRLGGTYGFG
jgi:hypothetical protein